MLIKDRTDELLFGYQRTLTHALAGMLRCRELLRRGNVHQARLVLCALRAWHRDLGEMIRLLEQEAAGGASAGAISVPEFPQSPPTDANRRR